MGIIFLAQVSALLRFLSSSFLFAHKRCSNTTCQNLEPQTSAPSFNQPSILQLPSTRAPSQHNLSRTQHNLSSLEPHPSNLRAITISQLPSSSPITTQRTRYHVLLRHRNSLHLSRIPPRLHPTPALRILALLPNRSRLHPHLRTRPPRHGLDHSLKHHARLPINMHPAHSRHTTHQICGVGHLVPPLRTTHSHQKSKNIYSFRRGYWRARC